MGDGLAADLAIRPAADDDREQASSAARVNEEQTIGSELGQGEMFEMARNAFGDAVCASCEIGAADL